MTNKASPETAADTADNRPADSVASAALNDDNWDQDGADGTDYEERWLTLTNREKERSRIQRQMRARRELEKRRDDKRLRDQVEDWPF
jgi:hypothetical protein